MVMIMTTVTMLAITVKAAVITVEGKCGSHDEGGRPRRAGPCGHRRPPSLLQEITGSFLPENDHKVYRYSNHQREIHRLS